MFYDDKGKYFLVLNLNLNPIPSLTQRKQSSVTTKFKMGFL